MFLGGCLSGFGVVKWFCFFEFHVVWSGCQKGLMDLQCSIAPVEACFPKALHVPI